MGLALDGPEENDEKFEVGGISFLIAPDVARRLPYGSQVQVDYNVQWERFNVYLSGIAGC